MKRLKLFFACLLMAVLSIGQVWADDPTVTIAYSTNSTTNMTGNNDAATVGLDASSWSVVGAKGGNNNFPGLNKNGYIALYYNATASNTLTVTNLDGATISEIAITYVTGKDNGKVLVDDNEVSISEGKYSIGASSFVITNGNTSNVQVQIKSIVITYSRGTTPAVLQSVAVSGTPTTKSYEAGAAFDPAGLVVTGTYDVGDPATITSSITWTACKTEGGTYVALNDEAVALAKDETGIYVKATVSEITSPAFHVTGLTVTAAQPKITITQAEIASFAGSYAEYTWTANTISGKVYAYKNAGIQFNSSKAGYYIYNTDPIPGSIRKITMTATGTARTWTPYVSTSAMTEPVAEKALAAQSVSSTTTWNVTGDNTYFYLTLSGGATVISSIVIEYEIGGSSVSTPTITGTDNFFTSTEITMTCGTEGAAIYYTTDATLGAGDPSTSTWTLYNSAEKPSIDATTTIYAAAKKDDDWSGKANATFNKATVLTVAQALTAIDALADNGTIENQYVSGVISQIDGYNSTYHSITYWISADGTTTNQLEVYSGKGLNGADFSAVSDLNVGDDVTVSGTLKKYVKNSVTTPEFIQNNVIVARKPIARLAWSGTTEGAYAASLEGGNTFPTLTNSDGVSVSYSSSETSYASFSDASDYSTLTLNAVGSTVITASFAGNESFKANSVSYTLNVSSSVIKADISYECNEATSCPDGELAASNLPSPLPSVTKAGKNFGGWFMDSEFNTPAVAGDAVASTDPITLYAKWLDPYTVAEALAIIDALEDGQTTTEFYYVAGEVTSDAVTLETGSSATYKIKDAGEENSLTIYKGKGKKTNEAPSGEDITEASYLQESDAVILYGQLQKYVKSAVTTPEVKSSYIYSLNRPEIAVTGVTLESTASVAVGKTINLSASVLPANATNKTINWSVQSGSEYASVADGVVTGIAEGTAVVRATSAADATKYAECTVTVAPLSPWASVYTSNVTLAAGSNAQSSKVRFTAEGTQYDAVKAGTGKAGGSITVTVPAQATALHLHVVGWSGENPTVTITAPTGVTVTPASISATADAGLSSNSPFTLQNDPVDQYLALSLSGNTEEIELTFSTDAGNKRFALYGVNQEGAVVLESISITGEATALEYNDGDHFSPAGLGVTGHYSDASTAPITEGIVWAFDPDPLTEGTTSVSVTATVGEISSDAVVVNGLTVAAAPAPTSGNIVILAEYNSKFYAMTNSLTSGALAGVEVEKDGSKIVVSSAEDKAAIQWTATVDGDNTTLKDGDDYYIKGSSGASLSLEADPYNWNWDGEKSCYISSAYTNRGLFFSNSGNVFKGYALSNITSDGYAATEVIEIDPEDIVITSKVDPQLAYTPASDEITVGDAWSAPALGYVEGFDGLAAISYESSDEAVATVSDAGVIALAGGTGTATITATFGGNASYIAGSATYTVKVNEVPDNCDATDDFSTANSSSPTSYTTRTTTAGWSATNAGYKVIDDASYLMINGKTTAVGVITSPVLSDGIASLKFRYANTNNESNGVSVRIDIKQGTEVVKTYTLTKANSEVTKDVVYTEIIENINVAGEFQIIFTNLSPSNNTGNADRVSIGRLCWENYSAPEPPTPAYTDIRTGLTAGNYYTVCWPKAMTAIKGGTLWSFAGKDAAMAYLIQEDAPFVAGRPYIIYATADKLEAVVDGDDALSAGNNNGLYGTFDYMDAAALSAAGATYMLKSNELRPIGTNNHLDANRAYVILNNITGGAPTYAPAHKVRAIPMQGNAATGVDELNAAEAPVKMLIDGQIFILRGEKLYDTTGRLVK